MWKVGHKDQELCSFAGEGCFETESGDMPEGFVENNTDFNEESLGRPWWLYNTMKIAE